MIRSIFKQAVGLAALSLWSLQALAALYGTVGAGGAGSTLVELSPATGAVIQTIGPVGYAVNGMTYDATTGTFYATTSNHDATFADGLITINMTTGAGTPVGTGAGQYVNVPSANSVGQLYGWTEAADDPVLWNKAAGTVTVIGESGIGTWEQSLAFDNNDVMYFLNGDENLYTINTTTGAATLVGAVTGVTTGYAHHGDFNPATNQLYAINQTNDSGTPNPRALYVIDITTQSVVATLPTVDNLHTLAFTDAAPAAAPTSIPTLSEWGMILLSSLLALGTIITLRHKRQ